MPSRCAQRVLDIYGLTDLLDSRPIDYTIGPWADFGTTSTAGLDGL